MKVFFSYARADAVDETDATPRPELEHFYKDLVRTVKDKHPKAVVFRDDHNIPLGDRWEERILSALADSKVMVCLYSPRYFDSEFCGKEWGIFRARLTTDPTLLIPVVWVPEESPPPAIGPYQYSNSDFPLEYERRGMKYFADLRDAPAVRKDYRDSLEALSTAIAKGLRSKSTLAAISGPAPRFADVVNPFKPPASTPAPAPPTVATEDADTVDEPTTPDEDVDSAPLAIDADARSAESPSVTLPTPVKIAAALGITILGGLFIASRLHGPAVDHGMQDEIVTDAGVEPPDPTPADLVSGANPFIFIPGSTRMVQRYEASAAEIDCVLDNVCDTDSLSDLEHREPARVSLDRASRVCAALNAHVPTHADYLVVLGAVLQAAGGVSPVPGPWEGFERAYDPSRTAPWRLGSPRAGFYGLLSGPSEWMADGTYMLLGSDMSVPSSRFAAWAQDQPWERAHASDLFAIRCAR